jgi:hypothetical protein
MPKTPHKATGKAVAVTVQKSPASLYTEELGAKICEQLAEGRTLRSICEQEGMPSEVTIRSWAMELDRPFAAQYARAREVGYQKMADDLIDIADGKDVAWTEADKVDGDGNRDAVQRDRLRVDTRKWLLSKALPKVYGDKIVSELTGKDGGPIEIELDAHDEINRRIAVIAARVGAGDDHSGSK